MSTAPIGAPKHKVQPLGSTYIFSVVDFSYGDADGDGPLEIIITSVAGSQFTYNGEPVVADLHVRYDDLESLVWTTPPQTVGERILEFTFRVVDDSGVEGADTDLEDRLFRFDVASAPQGADKTINLDPGESHQFSEDDFDFWDNENNSLRGIYLVDLPTSGTLLLDGNPVGTDFIAAADLSRLVWMPAETPGAPVTLTFAVDDSTLSTDPVPNTITFIVGSPNVPPAGSDDTITLDEDTPHIFQAADFGFSDSDGDSLLAVKIVSGPLTGTLKLGSVVVADGTTIAAGDLGNLVWTPPKDEYGMALATLVFQVIDNGGVAGSGSNIDGSANTLTFDVTSVLEPYVGTPDPDAMEGTPENDTFFGREGNDTIDGKAGEDTMNGETGNDTYLVDQATDTTIELSGQGTDTVEATVDWTLAANIERLTLTAASAVKGTGNNLGNLIIGHAGANRLQGMAGNDQIKGGGGVDTIHGGAGKDKLWGASGRDSFVFDTKPSAANRDTIMDFNAAQDTIRLENSVFTRIGRNGTLNREAFARSTEVREADDHIIYNKASGALSYDPDGSGRAAAVHFATIANKVMLTSADFVVI